MLRIAFGRKNKTLAAEFKNKKILEIIEKNYRTHCAINNLGIPMEFKMTELIDESLSEVNMADARARQMDIGTRVLQNNYFWPWKKKRELKITWEGAVTNWILATVVTVLLH